MALVKSLDYPHHRVDLNVLQGRNQDLCKDTDDAYDKLESTNLHGSDRNSDAFVYITFKFSNQVFLCLTANQQEMKVKKEALKEKESGIQHQQDIPFNSDDDIMIFYLF